MTPIPKFEDLPLDKSHPPFSAWSLYGLNDEIGTLNRLTDDVVLEAAKEIKTGKRISLNWPLNAQAKPFFARQAFHHDIWQKKPRMVCDDAWTMNSQSSTQFDGLRHFAYQKEQKFYNGRTIDQFIGPNATDVNGIQAMAEKGIVGRGILLDYETWRIENNANPTYDVFKTSPIPLDHLKAVARDQGVEIRHGDILFIRSGYTKAFKTKSEAELSALAAVVPPNFGGVEQSEDVLRWIWENFAAVAGDQPSFECWPSQREFLLHEVLLAGWGCPIGELFDLEALAAHCHQTGRFSFFLTSEPCSVPGGVASPPNALAIF